MANQRVLRFVTPMVCAGIASLAAAQQPKMIITGINNDMAATGNGVSGLVNVGLTGANSNYSTVPIIWSRGSGYTMIPGTAHPGGTTVSCSADMGALAMGSPNTANWGSLNCFKGYDSSGNLLPQTQPCYIPAISHRWTQAGGWVSTGSLPRFPDPVTGRMIGGTRCDGDINLPKDISGNGRYVLANAWSAVATNSSGGVATGLCGNFFPFRYDSVTGAVEQLPVQPGTKTSRADYINFDGSVMTGYDLGQTDYDANDDGIPDSIEIGRRLCVWRNGVQTLLDTTFGAKDNAAINGPGTILASGATSLYVRQHFPGQSGVKLVRWTWNGSAYIPENLGRPADYVDPNIGTQIPFSDLWVTGVSDDGNTIIGSAQYGDPPPATTGLRRPFIWRPSINGGVPMDLQAYIASIDNQASPIFVPGLSPTYASSLSADGNAVLVTLFDGRSTCAPPVRSHQTGNAGIIYLDGSGIACDPPRIGMGPESWADTSGLRYGVSLNVVASGSWPLEYRWQREDPQNPGTWNDLDESCLNFNEFVEWEYEGVYKNQLRIGPGNFGGNRAGNYRVVVSNSCGSVASAPATVTFVTGACCLSGGCFIDYSFKCVTEYGGTYMGDNSTCESAVCFPVPADCFRKVAAPQNGVNIAGGSDGIADETQCVGDWDRNGVVEPSDIAQFIQAWSYAVANPGTPGVSLYADVDCNQVVEPSDIAVFIQRWVGGTTPGNLGCN
ncbi:MAG: hypothetical protein KF745_07905 [Phycisphaeraceae bacterium]|nr:hypothetical protein [Phycisphaeraceae bacterium]